VHAHFGIAEIVLQLLELLAGALHHALLFFEFSPAARDSHPARGNILFELGAIPEEREQSLIVNRPARAGKQLAEYCSTGRKYHTDREIVRGVTAPQNLGLD